MYTYVYRLETSDGRGPYNGYHNSEPVSHIVFKQAHTAERQPTVWDDVEDFRTYEVCGCDSIDKLYDWFGKAVIDELKALGLRLMVYKVKTVHVRFGFSGKQVVFCKDDALEAVNLWETDV